jgi:hypothetical protein
MKGQGRSFWGTIKQRMTRKIETREKKERERRKRRQRDEGGKTKTEDIKTGGRTIKNKKKEGKR